MTRQRLKDLASLARRKGRAAHSAFLVEGVRSAEAAVQARAPLTDLLVAPEAAADPRVAALIEASGLAPEAVPATDLARLGDARTSQGVVAVSRSVVADRLGEAPAPALLLDGVQDPGNVGALVRTAAWFGVRTVVADAKTADVESPKAVRASMGGLWDVALVRVPSLVPVLDRLAEAGIEAWGADLGGTPVEAWDPGPEVALVMGSEAHGLSADVAAWLRVQPPRGSHFVYIPHSEAARETHGGYEPRGVESLNVGVAGGILLSRWLS
ncbi:MAG: RNA methyltransferase [Bacteroidota bacterium]